MCAAKTWMLILTEIGSRRWKTRAITYGFKKLNSEDRSRSTRHEVGPQDRRQLSGQTQWYYKITAHIIDHKEIIN